MFRSTLAILAIAFIGAAAHGDTFRAGAALRVVTPDPLLPVSGGVGTPNPTTEQKGDLFARAAVFERGDVRIAVVGVDFLGWPAVLADRARERVQHVKPEHILIGSTHTHSAPDPYGFPNPEGEHGADLDYLDWVCTQIAEAIDEAAEKLEPAHLKTAYGDAEGKIAYNYYAPQLYDPGCGVLQAIRPGSDEAIVTLVNYAIHPEVLGAGQGILSPDLCGPLYDRIEERTGGMALFMNGALGGMITADNRREGGGHARVWEECVRIGELLADEALRILELRGRVFESPELHMASKDVTFPIESVMMQRILELSPLNYGISDTKSVTTRVDLINIADVQALTIPGEALPNIGYYLKRNMPTRKPFLFGLTNDAFGYILTKVDFRSFKRYDYISFTSLGEYTGEIFIEEALDLVANNPEPQGGRRR